MANLKPNLPAPDGKVVPKVVMPGHMKMKTLRIMLEENEDIPPSGQFIGHNGNSYFLRPGAWVDVPVAILEILDNAVTSTPIVDPQTRQVIGHRPKLRYPYRIQPGQHDPRNERNDEDEADAA